MLRKRTWLKYEPEVWAETYREVSDFEQARTELFHHDLIVDVSALQDTKSSVKEMLSVAAVPELRDIAKRFQVPVTGAVSKELLMNGLLKVCSSQRTLFGGPGMTAVVCRDLKKVLGKMVRLDSELPAVLDTLCVAHFGLTQWSEDVYKEEILVVIQQRMYPQYELNDVTSLFKDRETLNACLCTLQIWFCY